MKGDVIDYIFRHSRECKEFYFFVKLGREKISINKDLLDNVKKFGSLVRNGSFWIRIQFLSKRSVFIPIAKEQI